MDETGKLILSICLCAVALAILIVTVILTRKSTGYITGATSEIEELNKQYYLNVTLKDNKYFPYFEKMKSGVKLNLKSKGEEDPITHIQLKKHYSFYDEKVIYIINNNFKYDKKIVEIDGQQYIEINKAIKTIELLVSSEKPSHFFLRFTFDGQGKMSVEEVKDNEQQEPNN